MVKRFIAVVLAALILLQGQTVRAQEKGYYFLEWLYEKYGIHYYMTEWEYRLLCHTVYCEAGNQPEEAQRLCAIVILNRVGSKKYPSTIKDVIYEKNGSQFNVVRWDGFPEAYPYNEKTETAVFYAIAQYPLEPLDLLAFRSGHHFSWGTPYEHKPEHGDMYFTRIKE